MCIIKRLQRYFLKHKVQYLHRYQKYSVTKVKPLTLIGFGNPLLDISARVEPKLLEKYELKRNRAYLAEPKHQTLNQELIKDYKVDYTAGGAVQNSLRVCQWILQKPYSTAFIGCVGNDDYSKILEMRATKDGVCTQYQCKNDASTGTCAVLITGTDRTLVANLAAAELFTVDHLKNPAREALIANAQYFYISGFFMTVNLGCILQIAQHAASCNNVFIFNLSASYIPHRFMESLKQVLPYVDILVGNEYEMQAFAKDTGWNISDRKEIGKRIQSLPKLNEQRSRIVIITQGALSVLVFEENDSIKEFGVPYMADEIIVDTNGAGDAFVGGFLAQYLQENTLDACIKCGIYAAQHILLQSGCTFEDKPNFQE